MAWVYAEQYFRTGEVADPRDFQRNVNRLAGEMNGHWDRDNTPRGTLTSAKLAVKALMATGSNPNQYVAGAPIQTLTAPLASVWTTIDPLTTTAAVGDCGLKAIGTVLFQFTGVGAITYNDKLDFRLLVDGNEVAKSGWYTWGRGWNSCRLAGLSSAPAGTSTLSMQARISTSPYTLIDDITNGVNLSAAYLANPQSSFFTVIIWAGNILYEARFH